jgi:hypothetical protein
MSRDRAHPPPPLARPSALAVLAAVGDDREPRVVAAASGARVVIRRASP